MAKRMVLVDEKWLDFQPMLQHFQTKQETRPTEQTVKSSINEDIRSTLVDPSIPEDVKAKHYSKQLNRYLNTKRKVPDVDELLDLKPDIKPLDDTKPEVRKGTRKRKRPKRFEWEEWE